MTLCVKQESIDDGWDYENFYENRIVYSSDGKVIKEHDCTHFNIKRLSTRPDEDEYVSDQIVVALGSHLSNAEVVGMLREIICVIEKRRDKIPKPIKPFDITDADPTEFLADGAERGNATRGSE